jgi:large repetitive protein
MLRPRWSRFLALVLLSAAGASAGERPPYNAYFLEDTAGRAAASAPAFAWGDRAGAAATTFEGAALEHLRRRGARQGLTPEALASAEVVRVHDTGRGGVVVVVGQRVDGVALFQHDTKVLLDRSRRLVAIGGALHEAAIPSAKHGRFAASSAQAAAAALGDLSELLVDPTHLVGQGTRPEGYEFFGLSGASPVAVAGWGLRTLRTRRVYFPLPDRLEAAYFVEIDASDPAGGQSAYAYVVSAVDRRVLYRSNLTHSAEFSYRVWASPDGDKRPADGPLADYTPYPAATPQGTAPAPVEQSLVTIDSFNGPHDPWLLEGATETRGNNVDAYTDDDSPDGFSSGDLRAKITSPGVFDHTYDPAKGPQSSDAQRMASATAAFYTINWLHDWWYDSGFDEKGRNAQKDNYGRGGLAKDVMLAQAQNGAPTQRNNANMSAFADGLSPRMQMFVWEGDGSNASLTLTPPGQDKKVGVASFGPQDFELVAGIALADDGVAPNADACEAIVSDVKGKIALVERGTCTFSSKALAAQQAGAVGMILYDNKPGNSPPTMPGSGDKIDIPALSILQSDGLALAAALGAGAVDAVMKREVAVDADGTIDNTVVAHEWGHYLHLRNVGCGSAMCFAQSEGWGDFTALMMVLREGDDLSGIFPLAQYASGGITQDGAYFGIRRYPYSVDKTVNPLTFRHVVSGEPLPEGPPVSQSALNDNAEAHAAGEVWASMLMEAYAALLGRSQGPAPAYTFDEARRRMSDYVVQGLQLAPTDPTFTEQRDAIFAAAAARDEGDVKVLVEAFARRGAGTCAVSPPRDSVDFVGAIESFEIQPSANILAITVDDAVTACDGDGRLDAGEVGKLRVTVRNVGTSTLEGAVVAVSSPTEGATFPAGATAELPSIPPFGTVEAALDVALAPTGKGQGRLDVAVSLQNVVVCAESSKLAASLLVNYDEIATGATVDSVEASSTAWVAEGKSAPAVWSRVEGKVGNHVWAGVDYGSPSDTQLVSPPLEISETEPLVLSFQHRHQFETSQGVFWDGSVIEITSNGGLTWVDIATLADAGYNGTIGDPTMQAINELRGREGFVDRNPSFPAMDAAKIDLGMALAGKTIRIRFRIGTDDAAGGLGWQLDDIGVSGATNAPFSGIIDSVAQCGAASVGGAGGAGGSEAGGGSGVASAPGAPGVSGAAGDSAGGKGGQAGEQGASDAAPTSRVEGSGGGCDCGVASPAQARRAGGALAGLFALLAGLRVRRRARFSRG